MMAWPPTPSCEVASPHSFQLDKLVTSKMRTTQNMTVVARLYKRHPFLPQNSAVVLSELVRHQREAKESGAKLAALSALLDKERATVRRVR